MISQRDGYLHGVDRYTGKKKVLFREIAVRLKVAWLVREVA
jgi:hypothetical protein